MKKRVKRSIAAGLGAIAVTATTQGPAAATEDFYVTGHAKWYDDCATSATNFAGFAGYADFFHYGEKFLIRDACSDKRGIRVGWRYNMYGHVWSIEDYIDYTGGFNPMGKEEDLNLPEGHEICFRVGLVNDGRFVWDSWGPERCTTTGRPGS